jgi:divalent metal cation (Fe/Co/Zn/Cd) transporter
LRRRAFQPADPIVGLGISAVILRIVWQSGREIGLRALDGVDAELIARIADHARAIPGVRDVDRVQARWLGHAIRTELAIAIDPTATVADADEVAELVRRRLLNAQPLMSEAVVRVVPAPG